MQYKLNYYSPDDAYGNAVTYVRVEDNGKMWVGNGEYESQVNFCPFTGTPAPVQMEVTNPNDSAYKVYVNK